MTSYLFFVFVIVVPVTSIVLFGVLIAQLSQHGISIYSQLLAGRIAILTYFSVGTLVSLPILIPLGLNGIADSLSGPSNYGLTFLKRLIGFHPIEVSVVALVENERISAKGTFECIPTILLDDECFLCFRKRRSGGVIKKQLTSGNSALFRLPAYCPSDDNRLKSGSQAIAVTPIWTDDLENPTVVEIYDRMGDFRGDTNGSGLRILPNSVQAAWKTVDWDLAYQDLATSAQPSWYPPGNKPSSYRKYKVFQARFAKTIPVETGLKLPWLARKVNDLSLSKQIFLSKSEQPEFFQLFKQGAKKESSDSNSDFDKISDHGANRISLHYTGKENIWTIHPLSVGRTFYYYIGDGWKQILYPAAENLNRIIIRCWQKFERVELYGNLYEVRKSAVFYDAEMRRFVWLQPRLVTPEYPSDYTPINCANFADRF